MDTPSSSYDNKLLNLKDGVCFFFVRVEDNIFGKLFYIKSKKMHAEPNKTASMLLYLLARDEKDDIHYETFVSLIGNKFNNIPGNAIDGFLDELKALRILDIETPTDSLMGVRDTKDADPMDLFTGDPINWAEFPPMLNKLDPTRLVDKVSHYYSLPSEEKKMNGATIRRP